MKDEEKQTIAMRFEEQAERHWDRIAVKTVDKTFTYGELNRLANNIASSISEKYPAGIEGRDGMNRQTAALLFEHGADMIAGMLGVIKWGGIYTALDPNYPLDRLSYIINHSKAGVIITDGKNLRLAGKLAENTGIPVIEMDSKGLDQIVRGTNEDPDREAYILYTSGSTGNPKGVVQNHRNILHFADCFAQSLNIGCHDKIALFTSYSHTVAVIDIFSAILNGAAIYPYDIRQEGNMGKLKTWIKDEGITVFHSVPTLYRCFVDTLEECEYLKSIRCVVVGGETVYKSDVELYKRYFPDKCVFVNLFGSSELIIAASNIINKNEEIEGATAPVGYAVKGVETILNDQNGDKAGEGETGEIVYKSRYLTPGYWEPGGLPQKTDAFETGEDGVCIFRSGDLGRFLYDGKIEYLGRKDFQIKIRGFRVEIEEIESILLSHPSVKEAVVIAKQDEGKDTCLHAFIVAGEVTAEEVRQYLGKSLPEHMVPSNIASLEEMPHTANGKIDRKALMETDIYQYNSGQFRHMAEDETEEMLAEVWREILDVRQVGVNESFFDLGGNSILAIKFEVEMEKRGINLNSGDIYELKTIGKLAQRLKGPDDQTGRMGLIEAEGVKTFKDGQASHFEKLETDTMQQGKVLLNIEPFNDVYYRSCYMNALFPAVKYFNRSFLHFLTNDIIAYSYKKENFGNIADYIPIKPVEKVIEDLGIMSLCKTGIGNLTEDLNSAILNGRPVILWIDCFYSPLRKDTYKKHHWEHCILVYGFNERLKEYKVIEHRHKDNLSYEKKVMKFQDIVECCSGYMDNYYRRKVDMPPFTEFYVIEDCNSLGDTFGQDTHFDIFVKNTLDKKKDILAGLETLKSYRTDFQEAVSSEEALAKNIDAIVKGLNDIKNIKQVERYRLEMIGGRVLKALPLMDEILANWEKVRKTAARYMYSSVYIKKALEAEVERIQHIESLESRYCEVLFEVLEEQ